MPRDRELKQVKLSIRAPKNAWKTLGALLSPFFQSARAVALRRRLSLLSNISCALRYTYGILKSWDVLSRCGADAPGKNERVAPRPRRFHYERAYRASTFEITNFSAQKTRYVSGPQQRLITQLSYLLSQYCQNTQGLHIDSVGYV